MFWVTVVVQFHPIIQRLGDQAVRVGCSMQPRGPDRSDNITVQSSFTFADSE